MKNKLLVYAICGALFALARTAQAASPTDGLVQYTDTFALQKPYDLNISDRFTASDVGGVLQYNCQVHSGDKALYITSTTNPRTEMRWNTNWNGTERMWQADVLVDSGTDNQTAIMQVKSNNGGNEAIYLTVNGGNLYDSYGSSPIASNIIGKWMNIICAYNPSTGLARVWINGTQVESTTRTRPAGTIFYFKNGTYHVASVSKDHFQNVKFWCHDQTGLVQMPSFTPLDATYANAQLVTIFSPTPGASIRYTTDGSTPTTTSGTLFTAPIPVTKGMTITAIAYKSGMTASGVNSCVYGGIQSTTFQVGDPVHSVLTGIYNGPQSVTLSSATSGATFRYTTDGSIPTETHGTLYTGSPIIISSDTTLQAIAYVSGQVDSRVSYAFYLINNSGPAQAAAPVFSPAAGTYSNAQNVAITSTTSGASIRYTTDGSTPSETAGTFYSGPVNISSSATLKAIAYEAGFTDSAVTSGTYTINVTVPQAAAPTFSPAAGTYTSGQSVTISSATSGASIRYTTDGSTPTETNGTIYSNTPVSVSASETLKAIAYESGFTDSTVSSAAYTISVGGVITLEAESLSPVGTGATVSTSSDANASGGIVEFLNSTAAGQTITFTTPSIAAGTYQVQLRYSANKTRGQHTVKVDGVQVGGTIDQYAASQSYVTATLGNATIGSGTHTIVMTVTGKNASATQFYLTADSFTFTPVSVQSQAAAPTFSPASGTPPLSVTITSATSGASIRYTTDGSTPSETAGTIYSGPVSISATTTLKAIAYEAGFTDSTVTSATYTATPPPTLNFEAESLSPVGTGATVSTSSDANASGGVVEFLNSTAAGQIMTFTTPSIPAGTYQFQLRYWANTTRGQHTVKVDGTQVGATIDQYASAKAYVTLTLGNVTFASAGTHSIALTVTGKNSAATQFYLTADKFTFVGQ
ncbi:MAG TPA: chitobiase/beta-hexosaminidase C-terminal domain-containing protein [Opitutaceae bacterium]|jgi:hypothetical protein|nr:chitobiase/beta-hexosaminidase C-terminal domain-containing protein [Opitutaceae bacterium]